MPINEAQSADNLFMLGLCQSYLGDEKDARKYWTKALTVEQPNKKSAAAGIQLSERYLKDGDEVSAIYLIYWAQHILGYSVLDIPKVQNIYNQSVDEITEKQFQYLYAKQGNYSLDNLSLFKSNKFQNLEGEIKKQKVDLAKRSNVVDQKLFAPFLNKAPQPTNNGMLRQYPERAWDVKPAYAGAYLIFKFPNMKKLGVFNIAQFRFEKYITLKSSHAIYATGGKILIVYEPDKREFILYNLSTFEVINTYKYRKTKEILSLDMGLLSGKRALVSIQETNKQYDRSYAFLELPSMDFQPLNFISSERALTDSGYSRIKKVKLQLRVSPRLHSIISWGTSETHSEGYGYSTIKGNKILSYFTRGEEFGALNFLDNTEEILSTNGDVLSPKGLVKRTIGDPTQVSFSVWGANLVVQAEKHKVKLMDAISKEVYNTYKIPFELTSQFNNLAHFTLEKSVFASAYLNRIIFIDNINNRIVSFKLLDESKLGLIRDQHIVVMPGDLWRKRMRYPAGTQIDIEDSPEGVTFDPTLLELNWDVPRRMSKGKYQILLYIKEPTKEPHYRRLTITVQ